jgi:hypothetical protein
LRGNRPRPRDIGEGVVDLVVDDAEFRGIGVFDLDARGFAERHFPVAVEGTAGIDADGERVDLRKLAPTGTEEIAERGFDGGMLLIVPPHADDEAAPAQVRRCQPDLLDGAHALDVGEDALLAGLDADRGRDLPPLPFAIRPRPRAWTAPVPSIAMPPLPLSPVKFSGEMERVLAGSGGRGWRD